jgi:hypothetical protein
VAAVQAVVLGPCVMVMLDKADQTRACYRLLSAVVITAIRDACHAPPREKTSVRTKISSEAFTAMRFLFDERVSGLNEYIMWFDIDAGQYRMRLRQMMADDGPFVRNGFDTSDRRNFRYNYKAWERTKDDLHIEDTEGENDD